MKATVLTIAISVLSLVCSVNNVSAANGEKLYKNEIMNEITNTLTITICKGENDVNLTPLRMHEVKYNEAGKAIAKTIYKRVNNSWIPSQKYEYSYGSNDQLALLSYVKWDNKNEAWSENISYTAYIKEAGDRIFTQISE